MIFCIIFLKKINTITLKVFFIYTIFSVLFLLSSLLALSFFKSSYFYLSTVKIFLMFEFIIICTFYNSIFKNKKLNQSLTLIPIFFVSFCIYNFYTTSKIEFDFTPLVLECLFFTIVILYFFYERIMHNFIVPLYQLPSFWISVAFLVYFSGNFFLFLFTKLMENEPGFINQYTLIYSSITILKNILLCTALIVNKNLIISTDNSSIIPNLSMGNIKMFDNQTN